jgi:hypothetical protein
MTDRLHDEQLDREIRRYLEWRADDVAGAPGAPEMAMRVSARVVARGLGVRLTVGQGWVPVVVLLLVLAVIGTVVAVGMIQPDRDPLRSDRGASEAIFLRNGAAVGNVTDVIVVGVTADGHEHQLAVLGGESFTVHGPWGAVSPGGLLAIASARGETNGMMHWEIVDLRRPLAAPVVIPGIRQFYEELRDTPYYRVNTRGGVFWGPGERLAIMWYYLPNGGQPDLQLAFVDGRTGASVPVDMPPRVLPYWASDGSGVFVSEASEADLHPPLGIDPQVLRPDGSIVAASEAIAEASCPMPSGHGFACLSPDGALTFDYFDEFVAGDSDGVLIPGSGAAIATSGEFAGWMEALP